MLRELVTATEEFNLIQLELADLYKQDKYGVYEGQALLVSENTTLRHARELITKIKIAQKPDKSSETMSVRSHDSRSSHASRASTSSSVARLRAAAEAAAAKEQAEYERLIAEKVNEMKQREAEEEKRRQQECAQHERDIAVMSANKRVGVANARLKAIQESILKKEINDPLELPNMDIADCQERTRAWVHSSTPKADDTLLSRVPHTPTDGHTYESPYAPEDGHTHKSPYTPKDRHTHESPYTPQNRHTLKSPHFLGERRTPAEGYTPGGGHIPIVNSTAKVIQKTLPSTIVPNELTKVNGEPPGTHYALNYSNPPRFSSRQPVLHSTPKEVYTGIPLETFTATNQQSAKDCARLQKLADLCADIDCQMTYLPGLACLNYPIAIRPIIEKLPAFLRSKWEKEIVRYAEEHNDAHPTFREFSTMIQNEAK